MKSFQDYLAETKIAPRAPTVSDKPTRQLLETIRRYGAVGNNRAMGYTNEAEEVKEHGGGIGPAKSWQSYMEDEGEGQLALKTMELEPTGPASDQIDEGMSEADEVIQDIINGDADAYDIMTNANTPAEKYVAQILDNMYDTAVIDYGLHADDDFEEILKIVQKRLADEYGRSEEVSESTNTLYRMLELADINKGNNR